jgi:predicted nucleic acid-binding protein
VIYIFDTNAITDLMRARPLVVANVRDHQADHVLCLCPPVDFEFQRGLLWKSAYGQRERYLNEIKTQFQWLPLSDTDWLQAGQFWADTQRRGKQLSDVDLLVAALAQRLDAIIMSSDTDFDVLPVKREDWRNPR